MSVDTNGIKTLYPYIHFRENVQSKQKDLKQIIYDERRLFKRTKCKVFKRINSLFLILQDKSIVLCFINR